LLALVLLHERAIDPALLLALDLRLALRLLAALDRLQFLGGRRRLVDLEGHAALAQLGDGAVSAYLAGIGAVMPVALGILALGDRLGRARRPRRQREHDNEQLLQFHGAIVVNFRALINNQRPTASIGRLRSCPMVSQPRATGPRCASGSRANSTANRPRA